MRRITPKRLLDPFLIGTPKLHKDSSKQQGDPQRAEPLPELKKLKISEKQPMIRRLPDWRKDQKTSESLARKMAILGTIFSVPLLILCCLWAMHGLGAAGRAATVSLLLGMHLCVACAVFPRDSTELGILPLVIFYGGAILVWSLWLIF
ncbi:MAG: hypothetical protein R3242_08645 [Akkermansiaceae bacterium]|nr:hypothetical protein [Akkermansiaceae bacterium]